MRVRGTTPAHGHNSPFSEKRMNSGMKAAAGFAVVIGLLAGCSTAPKTPEKRENLRPQAGAAVDTMTAKDATLRSFLDRADGYAVFPNVGKGGAVVGGAYGKGIVYEQGRPVGY